MKWVKLTETVPESIAFALYNGDHVILQVHDGGFRLIFYSGKVDDAPKRHLIRWLDESESPEPQTGEQDKLREALEKDKEEWLKLADTVEQWGFYRTAAEIHKHVAEIILPALAAPPVQAGEQGGWRDEEVIKMLEWLRELKPTIWGRFWMIDSVYTKDEYVLSSYRTARRLPKK